MPTPWLPVARLGSLRLLQGRKGRDLLALAEPLLDVEPAPPDVLVADGDSLAAYGIDATVLHTGAHARLDDAPAQ